MEYSKLKEDINWEDEVSNLIREKDLAKKIELFLKFERTVKKFGESAFGKDKADAAKKFLKDRIDGFKDNKLDKSLSPGCINCELDKIGMDFKKEYLNDRKE